MSLEAERGVLARQGYTTRPRPAIESNATVSPTKSSPAKIPRRRLSKNGHVARAVAESAIGGVGSDSNRHAEGREESLVDELVSRRQRRRTTARPPPPGRDSSTLFSSLSLSSLSLSRSAQTRTLAGLAFRASPAASPAPFLEILACEKVGRGVGEKGR